MKLLRTQLKRQIALVHLVLTLEGSIFKGVKNEFSDFMILFSRASAVQMTTAFDCGTKVYSFAHYANSHALLCFMVGGDAEIRVQKYVQTTTNVDGRANVVHTFRHTTHHTY
jgi:hypothetical protein